MNLHCPRTSLFVAVIGTALGGCAQRSASSARSDQSEISKLVSDRTGQTVPWDAGTTEDRAVRAAIDALLEHDLTADRAVQIALLNNHDLQATLAELGIAQAQLVQAGLLQNPVFDASVRFPDGGGKTDPEFSVAQNFVDLLALPLRKRVAAAGLEATKLRVAAAVIDLAMQTQSAFYTAQAAAQIVTIRQREQEAAALAAEGARRLHDAGNLTELEFANEEALDGETRLSVAQAEADVVSARERLIVLMGLWGQQTQFTLSESLPDLPASEIASDGLERFAVEHRLDLAASRAAIESSARSLGAARPFALVSDAEIGVDTEREVDTPWLTGPTFSLPIPLFDRGQGTIPRLAAELNRASQKYYAAAVEVRSDVRATWARVQAARARTEFYQRTMIPLRTRIVQQTQLQYNGMEAGIFQLLQAKQDELEATRAAAESLRDYWIARSDLQHALGGRLPESITQQSGVSK